MALDGVRHMCFTFTSYRINTSRYVSDSASCQANAYGLKQLILIVVGVKTTQDHRATNGKDLYVLSSVNRAFVAYASHSRVVVSAHNNVVALP